MTKVRWVSATAGAALVAAMFALPGAGVAYASDNGNTTGTATSRSCPATRLPRRSARRSTCSASRLSAASARTPVFVAADVPPEPSGAGLIPP